MRVFHRAVSSHSRRVAALASLLGLSSLFGCSSSGESCDSAAVRATMSGTATHSGFSLYDLPEMQRARLHRERGMRVLAGAYSTTDGIQRIGLFNQAYAELDVALGAYQDAYSAAPKRFEPVIDNECAQVASYMRQIQRDREALKPAEEKR